MPRNRWGILKSVKEHYNKSSNFFMNRIGTANISKFFSGQFS